MNPEGRVAGAVVEVVDGPNAGRQATTDDHGRYVLESLEEARMTVRATAEGFASVDRTFDLSSDTALAFAISRRLQPSRPPVPFPDTDPEWLQELALDYPYMHNTGNVRVFSDISQGFSVEHAEHLLLVWNFFDDLYDRNGGDYLDIYYTLDPAVFLKRGPPCPARLFEKARTSNWCLLDYPRWFIIPFQTPDYGTQLHEIGHGFLFATTLRTQSGPTGTATRVSRPPYNDIGWFAEGTAMYFEGGVFNDSGSLRVETPFPWCIGTFRTQYRGDGLTSLARLLHAPDRDFWEIDGGYGQTCMLFDYLERHEPGVLYALIQRINSGVIITNDNLVTALLELTGQSLADLEEAYESYALSVIFGR